MNCAVARKNARHVAVEDGKLFAVCDAQNRSCRVISDTRQGERILQARWKLSSALRHDLLRGFLQVARAAVIAKPGPETQYFIFRRCGKCVNVREMLHESFVVGNRGRNAGLLQHNFRQPDAIRIRGSAPRQITLKLTEPAQQLLAKCGEFAAVQHSAGTFSHS